MVTKYGFGDEQTWGPIIDPRDPRYREDDDDDSPVSDNGGFLACVFWYRLNDRQDNRMGGGD